MGIILNEFVPSNPKLLEETVNTNLITVSSNATKARFMTNYFISFVCDIIGAQYVFLDELEIFILVTIINLQ